MQAENTHFAASGTANPAVSAGKRIQFSSRAIHSDGERATSAEIAKLQTQESPIPDGLTVPAQAFLRAHQPLRFLFDQALLMLAPCAALLGFSLEHPSARQEKQPDSLPDAVMEDAGAYAE